MLGDLHCRAVCVLQCHAPIQHSARPAAGIVGLAAGRWSVGAVTGEGEALLWGCMVPSPMMDLSKHVDAESPGGALVAAGGSIAYSCWHIVPHNSGVVVFTRAVECDRASGLEAVGIGWGPRTGPVLMYTYCHIGACRFLYHRRVALDYAYMLVFESQKVSQIANKRVNHYCMEKAWKTLPHANAHRNYKTASRTGS